MGFDISLLLLAFGFRLGVVLWLNDTVPYSDFVLYHAIGQKMAHGDWGTYLQSLDGHSLPQVNWWPPGYPVFLALVYLAFGDHYRNAVLVQVLLGALTCWLLYRVARRFLPENIARLGAVMLALNPHLVFLTNQLASENLFVFYLALACYLVVRRTPGALFWGGLVAALAALTRSAGFAWILVLALGLWLLPAGEPGPNRRRLLGMFAVGLACCLVPWTIRNLVVLNKLTPASLGAGVNFYFGHNPEFIGHRDLGATPLAEAGSLVELDERGYREAWRYIRRAPGALPARTLGKLGSFFGWPDYALHVNSAILIPDTQGRPELLAEAQAKRQRQKIKDDWLHGFWTTVARAYFVVLSLAAFAALFFLRGAPTFVHWSLLFVAAHLTVHLIFWASPRFRLPAEVFMSVAAAWGLAALWRSWNRRPATPPEHDRLEP